MEVDELQKAHIPFKKKILIADDCAVTLASFSKILSSDEYQTVQASNGQEALDRARAELPDLILLDVMMPGMNGLEAARELKRDSRTNNIPIILVTALDGTENKQAGIEAGAEDYLAKPVRSQELIARVNSMITLKQYRDQLAIRHHSQRSFAVEKGIEDTRPETEKELPLVLVVEDNQGDAQLVKYFLKNLPLRVAHVTSGKEALQLVQSGNVDLMLLDIFLPDSHGFDVCRQVKDTEKGRDVPIVVMTCLDDFDSKVKCIELNTDDFLVKPIVGRELQARVKILLEKKKQLDSLRSHYETVLNSAIVDWLTGLYNHGFFKRSLELEIKKSLRQRYPIALIMIDIDNFKTCNDLYGNSVGDAVLQELAQVIRKGVREIDLVARYGGDEFAVILPYSDGGEALPVAQRIDEAIKTHLYASKIPSEARVTVSIGIAWFPEDAVQADELIHKADLRLYASKQKGKIQIADSV